MQPVSRQVFSRRRSQRQRKNLIRGFLLLASVMLLTACGTYFLAVRWIIASTPRFVNVPEAGQGVGSSGLATLSTAQVETISRLGYPDAFTILFYTIEMAPGALSPVRSETWSYYHRGLEINFLNGEQIAEQLLDFQVANLVAAPYRPEQFYEFMSLAELVDAAGVAAYIDAPLDAALLPEGRVFYAPQLSFGLQEGELLYVEAFALEAEASQ